MRITTLGTSCAQQTYTRTQCCNAITWPDKTYLFDCGSSVATQLLLAKIKLSSIRKIFITHLHTDHVIGLPGLLTDMLGGHGGNGTPREITGKPAAVDIYGPKGLRELIRTTFRLTYTAVSANFRLIEWDGEDDAELYPGELPAHQVTLENGAYRCQDVQAVKIIHTVPCFGYIVREPDRWKYPPNLPREEYVRLKAQNGGARIAGSTVVILGDTCDASAVLKHVSRPAVVIHEATNACLDGDPEIVRERAISRGHSTPEMAGAFAAACHAEILILTHFSSRYSGADNERATSVMAKIEDLARVGQHKVIAAWDGMYIDI